MNPLFSIVLTTYNRSQLLPRAIRSVLQQSFTHFELIIVDDCSTDNTQQILSEFSDPRLVTRQHSKNQGVSTARNTGIQNAKGEYLCFLDDDDELFPTFLEEIHNFLEKRQQPFIGLIWTGIVKIVAPTTLANEKKRTKTQLFTIDTKKNYSFLIHVLFSGITIHRIAFERVGVFNPQLRLREDADIIFRMLAKGLDCASIPKALIKIHHHEYTSLSRSIHRADRIDNMEYFLVAHDPFLNQHLPLWLHYYTSLVGDYYHSGKKQQARKLVRSICKKRWFSPKIWELFLRFECKSIF
ncbi:MAG: glycosyltransferase family 2 protein [Pseudomonadota bacterium]